MSAALKKDANIYNGNLEIRTQADADKWRNLAEAAEKENADLKAMVGELVAALKVARDGFNSVLNECRDETWYDIEVQSDIDAIDAALGVVAEIDGAPKVG